MKSVVKILANNKNLSVNAYLIDLIRKDQEGMFDTMQIAEKNREKISGIEGNMHDGYNVIFNDGHTVHCRTKKDVRPAIISYLHKENKCLTEDKQSLTEDTQNQHLTLLLSCYYQRETLRNADKEKSHKIGVLPNFTGCKKCCFLSLRELRSLTSFLKSVFHETEA